MGEERKRQALLAVLRVAAKFPHLLDEDAFAELEAALHDLIEEGRLTVLVPDAYLSLRVYAMGSGPRQGPPSRQGPEVAVAFGGRIPGVEPAWRTLFVEGRAVVCEDMSQGNEVDRAIALGQRLSYVATPCRADAPRPRSVDAVAEAWPADQPARTEGRRVVAVMVVTYPTTGARSRALIDALQEVADVLAPSFERATSLARERRLAMILDTSCDGMLAWDRSGSITDCNAAAEVLAGRPRAEMLRMRVGELLDPSPEAATGPADQAGVRLTLLARGPGQQMKRVPVAATVIEVDRDARVAAHALLRDLTNVVAAEARAASDVARIHELEERHRTLLDNAPVIIFRLDATTRELVYLNRQAERLLGVPMREALSTPGFLRGAHADPQGVAAFDAAVRRAALAEPAAVYEARLAKRGGDTISVRGSVYPLLAEGGRVDAIEGVLADVSAEHAARARLVQADRLSTLGTLAAGVAHEINNPAAFMLLGLDLLGRQLEGGGLRLAPGVASSVEATLAELRASIRRIVDIARDLRLFASVPVTGGERRALVDVKAAVESALSLTRGQLLERARLDVHLEDVPPVLMDEGRLGQVIVNLLVNAAQAIPGARSTEHRNAEHRIGIETRAEGRDVLIEVIDTGVGISRENAARIWEPFFTTKDRDAGTGLGLSISQQIIQRAGGTIVAESPYPGRTAGQAGARFLIRLPAAGADASEEGRSVQLPPLSAPRKARVLVVEDESALARALAEALGDEHEVVVASGAAVALVCLQGGRFDVVLCDLRMPVMSGEALYKRVRARDAAQADRFVFMTGVGFGADLTRFLSESGREVLEKPFPASRALDAIARVLRQAVPWGETPKAAPEAGWRGGT